MDRPRRLIYLNEQFSPTLGALAHAGLEADQFLLAFRGAPISTSMHMWTAPSPHDVEPWFDQIACDHMSGLN
jgi:hypothetical protein